MPGRKFKTLDYRYGFNGKEKDDEMDNVEGGDLDFGARIYDSRLGRWMSTDPKAFKYTAYSPYHGMYCNPVVVKDKDGNENIVVIGNQGLDDPNSDKMGNAYMNAYKYGDNTRYFLQAGLEEAIRLKNDNPLELTTIIVYKGNYSQGELDNYENLANASGIIFKVEDNVNQIADYINKKNDHLASRGDDLITDFSYVGHSAPGSLWVGDHTGNGKKDISVWDITNKKSPLLDKDAFSKSANVVLNSCRTFGSPNEGNKNIAHAFSEIIGKDGSIRGTENYVNWGYDSNGNFGLGKFTWNHGDHTISGKNKSGGKPEGDGGVNDPRANKGSGNA